MSIDRNVLVIEDNREISDLVSLHLCDMGCNVRHAGDGETGLKLAADEDFDLIILDLMLPTIDGLQVCSQLRARSDYVPILMLTAKSTEVDRVVGLELGADDYLTKPFSIHELLARTKAIFRRCDALSVSRTKASHMLRMDDMDINLENRTVICRGRPVDLTAKEFDLLVYFAESPGRVHSRKQLLDQVWGYRYIGYEHTVNSHINRLRAKIEQDPSQPHYVLTVWGVGYKFNGLLTSCAA